MPFQDEPNDPAGPATLQNPRFLDRRTPPNIFTLVYLSGITALAINLHLPALPSMAEYFQADYALMQLSVAVYLGMSAVIQIFIGAISDQFGRRNVVLGGMAIFLVATLGCIFAPNIWVFLFCRVMQAFAVVGQVLSRAIVRDVAAEDRAASMLGYVTMGMAVAPMIGPAIGGALAEAFGWSAIFWFLIALGIGALILSWADLGETSGRRRTSMAAQIAEYPDLLTSPRFWAYCMASALSAGAFFAYLGGAPYIAEVVFGMTPSRMGLFFGAPAIGYFVGNFLSGRYSMIWGANRMLVIGSIIVPTGIGISLTLFYLGLGDEWVFFGFMSCVGLGNGMVIPNATAAMLSVRPQLAGTAAGLGGAMMIGGGAALSALAGTLLTPESGPFPLLWLMVSTGVAGSCCGVYAWIRSRRLMGL